MNIWVMVRTEQKISSSNSLHILDYASSKHNNSMTMASSPIANYCLTLNFRICVSFVFPTVLSGSPLATAACTARSWFLLWMLLVKLRLLICFFLNRGILANAFLCRSFRFCVFVFLPFFFLPPPLFFNLFPCAITQIKKSFYTESQITPSMASQSQSMINLKDVQGIWPLVQSDPHTQTNA